MHVANEPWFIWVGVGAAVFILQLMLIAERVNTTPALDDTLYTVLFTPTYLFAAALCFGSCWPVYRYRAACVSGHPSQAHDAALLRSTAWPLCTNTLGAVMLGTLVLLIGLRLDGEHVSWVPVFTLIFLVEGGVLLAVILSQVQRGEQGAYPQALCCVVANRETAAHPCCWNVGVTEPAARVFDGAMALLWIGVIATTALLFHYLEHQSGHHLTTVFLPAWIGSALVVAAGIYYLLALCRAETPQPVFQTLTALVCIFVVLLFGFLFTLFLELATPEDLHLYFFLLYIPAVAVIIFSAGSVCCECAVPHQYAKQSARVKATFDF